MKYPIYLSFLWHMHQPYYKNIETNKFILPWVRLHGVKDYYDMVSILRNYPKIKQNFNLVPSLLKQIEEYINGTTDIFMDMSLKKAGDLNKDERVFILNNFFMANWHTMVYPYKRYAYLLQKRGENTNPDEIKKIHKNFSDDEIRDLQVWFNLTWIDSDFFNKFPELRKIKEKAEYFTEEEKNYILNTHIEILKLIIPEYRALQEMGKIEISTTPFYHPILPLLYNTDIAKKSMPGITLDFNFSHPEDAEKQIQTAIDFHTNRFGKKPNGFWPSEGSVSEEVLDIFIKNKIKWIATDEEILKNTLNDGKNIFLYMPYTFETSNGKIDIFFRNHYLSDLIGFTYQSWNTKEAVDHFIGEIEKIQEQNKERVCHINVILDGENAWEFYPNDGKDFLNELYEKISKSEKIKTILLNEARDLFSDKKVLKSIFPGSWINHDFYIWIGHEDDKKSWQLLKMVRDDLIKIQNQKKLDDNVLKNAWEEIYIAEGSDWNWWYGDDHSSKNDAEFDNLYRLHLMNVYKILGEKIPDILYVPISKPDRTFSLQPSKFIYPVIDGYNTDFFEWKGAGVCDFSQESAMHKVEKFCNVIYYGFNLECFFVRLDFLKRDFSEKHNIELKFISEKNSAGLKININSNKVELFNIITKDIEFSFNDILEIKIPFENLKEIINKNEMNFIVFIKENDKIIEKIPEKGAIKIFIPDKNFQLYNWKV